MTKQQFISLADRLAREERLTREDCPIWLRHRDGGGHPFPCIHTDRDGLLILLEQKEPQQRSDDVRIESIFNNMLVAVPRKGSYRLKRAEQLLEACGIPPYEWEAYLEQ